MAYGGALSIPAGKTEFDDMMRRSGLAEESYWLQRDPERGDQLLFFGRDDLTAFNAIMANPQTEFARWYRDQLMTLFGEDPAAEISTPNEWLGTWTA